MTFEFLFVDIKKFYYGTLTINKLQRIEKLSKLVVLFNFLLLTIILRRSFKLILR